VKIALCDHSKRTNRRQRAALDAVEFVYADTVTHLLAIAPARQVEVSREHVARLALVGPVAQARAATPAKAAVPGTATNAIVVSQKWCHVTLTTR
jgi:hypothetical protein